MIAGTVEIQMLADMARLREDVSTGVGLVERGAQKMQEVAGLAGKALGLIGVSLSGAAFGAWIKGAIDSADAASKLSQRAGVAVADVAGLQLAFDLGGSSAEGMAGGLTKLAKNMVEGGKSFDELGVKTRNADGTMRGVKDVFYDVADAFAGIEDGAAKSALAQQIFGKSGAELLPVLNGGSAGLREMAEMADKLGLTLSDETAKDAEKFNDTLDLLHKSTQGIATRIAAQMLPTLNSMAGALLETATEGDTLNRAADILAGGLKLLFSAGALGVEVFNTLGKTIGGVAAAIVSVAKGEFAQAKSILGEMGSDISAGWSKSAATVAKAWGDSGSKSVTSLTAVAGAQRRLALQTNEEAAESKKLADQKAADAKKAEEDYRKLIDKINEKTKAVEQETLKGRALTESEKIAIEIEAKYTGEKLKAALATLEKMRAAEDEKRATELSTKATEAATAARLKEAETISAGVLKLDEEIEAQRAANITTLTGVDNTAALTVARLRDAAASAERQAMVALERKEDEVLYQQYKLQAEKLRELADLKEQGIHVKAAKDAQDAWQKTTDSIGQGLTDSLYRAFEAGEGFFSTLWSGIKNTLKTTVLKVAINAVMSPINTVINSAMGGVMGGVMGSLGGGAAGGGGILGALGSLGSMGSGLMSSIGSGIGKAFSSAGDWMTGGLGNLADGPLSGLGGWLSETGTSLQSFSSGASTLMSGIGYAAAAFSAINDIKNGAWGSAIGTGLGAWFGGPIGSFIGGTIGKGVDKLFGGNGTHHAGAGYVSDGTTGRNISDGSMGLSWSYGDSVGKYYSSGVSDALKSITGGSASMLNELSKTFGGGGGYQVGAYFASDNDRESQGSRSVLLNGQILSQWGGKGLDKDPTKGLQQLTDALAGQVRDAMAQIDIPNWARETLNQLGAGATMEQLAAATQSIIQSQQALKGMGDLFAPLGGVFARIGDLSGEAKMQLLQFAGGLEALAAKAQSYVANYYSETEQAALQAAGIKRALDAAGITGDINTREDFRTLVDATDVQTEDGRRRLVTLLDIQQSFAGVADYIEKTGTTLDALAASAPQLALLQQQVDGQAAQVDAAQQTVEAVNTVNESILGVQQALSFGLQVLADKLDQVVSTAAENASYIAGTAAQRQYAQA
ncbi:hypothetical protein [Roseateles asaccharophilus]|uniref:FlaG/YvyC family protein n=1 Tax=Roseateles asaccharophilus TaxID=582607 RepID=A0ABU2A5J6_9BURK|nr:hypothetical protein [Roseateles asaccharophilus]MDR7331767.1 putative FlaG/YvyC family protein [Roseateles asaccharophilus]